MNTLELCMFKTEILQQISEVFTGEICFKTILDQQDFTQDRLEAQLLHAAQLRNQQPSHFNAIIQSAIHPFSHDIAYLFAPFILSNLNLKTLYTTPKTPTVLTVFNSYFNTSEMQLAQHTEILKDLNFSIQLSDVAQNEAEFLYQYLLAALCNEKINHIFIISDVQPNLTQLKTLEIQLGVRIFTLAKVTKKLDIAVLDMRKLLFKNKDTQYMQLCADFAEINAQILVPLMTLTQHQAQHLIDDMFYSEHIFEKLSVYSEYMSTCIFNAQQLVRAP